MGLHHHKLEGGQGGRRGHSNMDHWLTTAEIKDATRGGRRRAGKAIIEHEMHGHVPTAPEGGAAGVGSNPKAGRLLREATRTARL